MQKYYGTIPCKKEVLKLSDGGQILLAWYQCDEEGPEDYKQRTNPIIVLIPGLSGCHDSLYCQSVTREAFKGGYDVVCVNFVGMAGLDVTSGRVYDPANIRDHVEAVKYVHKINPDRRMFGAGCSLGAGLMSNVFAKMGDDCPMEAGFGVNSHFNSWTVQQFWHDHFFGLYDLVLGAGLKLLAAPSILQANEINKKTAPERVVPQEIYDRVNKVSEFSPQMLVIVNGHLYKNYKDLMD